MTIKNLLVAFNGSPASESAVRAAVMMQAKYDAHITGLLAHEGSRDRFSRRPWVPDNVRAILEETVSREEQAIEARFRDLIADVPANKAHWITIAGAPDGTFAQYACMFDLTLVGQHGTDDLPEASLHPERVALRSGRPVLVIPTVLEESAIRRRAVLAWDGQRAATRAMNDAMQILETKQAVDVLSIGDEVRGPLKGIDAVTSLGRHGISANRIRKPGTGRNVGAAILDHCDAVDAGLLVMGAFEHSVFREELFGGTTKFILANATIPVLISH